VAAGAHAQWEDLLDPDVPVVSVQEVARAVQGPSDDEDAVANAKPLLLVDVRSARETAVSIIPGAVTRDAYERNASRYRDYRIVPYCTVGVRSGRYTRKLLEQGVDAVNFEGSIIAWVEAGMPLVTLDGEATRRVHTWSRAIRVPEGYEQVAR
jgi:rhodanese-related sulfurtransferase